MPEAATLDLVEALKDWDNAARTLEDFRGMKVRATGAPTTSRASTASASSTSV